MNKQLLLEAFKLIQNGKIPDRTLGLCYNVSQLHMQLQKDNKTFTVYESLDNLVKILAKTWDKHSGSDCWPVYGKYSFSAIDNLYDIYTTPGKLRFELLQHIINELELPNNTFNSKYAVALELNDYEIDDVKSTLYSKFKAFFGCN